MTDTTNPDVVDEYVTDEDVEQAEAAAREAEQLVATLEQQVEDGDETVTPEQITEQEGLSRFAKLRLTAVRKKAEKARAARRLNAAQALHDEIAKHGYGEGERVVELLRAIEDAEEAYFAEIEAHNARVKAWRARAIDLKIPASTGAAVPPAEHGRVAVSGDYQPIGLNAGGRTIKVIDATSELAAHRRAIGERPVPVHAVARQKRGEQYERLGKIDAQREENPLLQFWRTRSGQVLTFDHAPSDGEITAGGLERISRKEAWGE